jgi:hypothetical protein
MAGSDPHGKLLELIKLLEKGKGTREETVSVLTETAERLHALDVSNKRLREEARGPAQAAWTQFMGNAIEGYLADPNVASADFDDGELNGMLNNCEDIADGALVRWKMRWVDGVAPTRRARKQRGDVPDQLPKPGEIASPDQAREYARQIEDLFGSGPRPALRMVDAVTKQPAPAPDPVEPKVEAPPRIDPAPKPAAKVEPSKPPTQAPAPPAPPPAPREPRTRQPGDD